jgi:hypothetical protein
MIHPSIKVFIPGAQLPLGLAQFNRRALLF